MRNVYVSLVFGVVAALLFVPGCSTSRTCEPVFEGKRLGVWLVELNQPLKDNGSLSQLAAQNAMWTNVVQDVGTNGLPLYVGWIQNSTDIPRRYGSELAIEILGPAAQPAIPALAGLLRNDQTAPIAAECLLATGPAAIPALTEAAATMKNRGRSDAISILGEFGPAAGSAAPVLIQIIKNEPMWAWPAMQTLVEIETNAAVLLPLFGQHVADTNNAAGAAYALGRLGNAGVPMLLLSLTSEPRNIRCFAAGALDPDFQKYSTDKQDVDPVRFRRLRCIFNLKVMTAASRCYSVGDYVAAAQTAGRYTNSADATIRAAAIEAFNYLRPFAETNVPQMKIDEHPFLRPAPKTLDGR